MQVWKQLSVSIILALGVFNDFIRGLSNLGKVFAETTETGRIESHIENRETLKDMAKKFDLSDKDLDDIRNDLRAKD